MVFLHSMFATFNKNNGQIWTIIRAIDIIYTCPFNNHALRLWSVLNIINYFTNRETSVTYRKIRIKVKTTRDFGRFLCNVLTCTFTYNSVSHNTILIYVTGNISNVHIPSVRGTCNNIYKDYKQRNAITVISLRQQRAYKLTQHCNGIEISNIHPDGSLMGN